MLSRWITRLRALFRGHRADAEFDEELRYHLEQQIEQNLSLGMDAKEARAAALRQFGNPLLLRDQARETWRWRRLDELAHDLRYAVRGMRNNPGFSAVAILSLGFGIGATTTLFSVIDAVDFRPLPYHEPDRLVWLALLTPEDYPDCARCPSNGPLGFANEWRQRTNSFAGFAVQDRTSGCLDTDGRIECFNMGRVSAGFFTVLGVRPVLGRDFAPHDTAPGAAPVVILSHETWQRRYGGDPAVIGSQFEYAQNSRLDNSSSSTIIGVLPRGFRFGSDHPAWVPFPDEPERSVIRTARMGPSTWFLDTVTVIARLKPGIEPAIADAELRAVHAGLATDYPEVEGATAAALPLRERTGRNAGEGRGTLFSITLIVLGIAVLNVAGLLMSRAAARRREFSVRRALGASHGRLIRQVLVEGLALGLSGGLLGLVLCVWGVRVANLHFDTARYGYAAQLDHRVLAFATTVALAAGIVATVLPALGIGRRGRFGGLRDTAATAHTGRQGMPARSGAWTPGALLACQIAAALILLTAAGLLGSDYLMLRYLDIGYDPVNLHEAIFRGPDEYDAQPELMRPIAERARVRTEQIPEVLAASLIHYTAPYPEVVRLEGVETTPDDKSIFVGQVEVDYFDTMGMRVLQGRGLSPQDSKGAPAVAVINRTAAAAFGPGSTPLGRRVFVGRSPTEGEWLTVVGVVEDVERGWLVRRHYPWVYRPLAQAPIYAPLFRLHFRVADGHTDAVRAVETVLRDELGHPISPVVSHEEDLGGRFVSERVNAVALNAFAAFAILLAAIGVYGTVAYAVARRTREIGIRMALGAERRSILALFARRAAVITTFGAALGLGGSLAVARVLQSFVSATSVTDARVFGVAILILIAGIFLAAYMPARRATAVDPTLALRAE